MTGGSWRWRPTAPPVPSYGAWVATRYKDTSNIVWMIGGDFAFADESPEFSAVEQAMIDGMLSVAGQQSILFSNEWRSEHIGTDEEAFGRYINLNGCYSFDGNTASICRRGYAHTPAIPAFLQEGPFDEEGPDGNNVNRAATQRPRATVSDMSFARSPATASETALCGP